MSHFHYLFFHKNIILKNYVVIIEKNLRLRSYQDAMAIVRVFGRPTYFVTFTCNTNWPEIQAALLPGQDAQSRPDLVARVFHQKLKALLHELTSDGIFGHCVSMLMVVEFQKRGQFPGSPLYIAIFINYLFLFFETFLFFNYVIL